MTDFKWSGHLPQANTLTEDLSRLLPNCIDQVPSANEDPLVERDIEHQDLPSWLVVSSFSGEFC